MACARDRAASRWAGEVPVDAPQLGLEFKFDTARNGEGRAGVGYGKTYKTAITGPAGVLAADGSCPMLT